MRLNLKDEFTYNNRGYAYLMKGNLDSALADLNEAIRINPRYIKAYGNRSVIWHRQWAYDREIADLNEALRIGEKNSDVLTLRGIAYAYKGEWDKSLADFNEVIRLDTKSYEAYRQRGALHVWRGEINKAIEDFTTAIRLDPKETNAYLGLANCFSRKQQYEKAIGYLDEAIKLSPKSPCYYEARGVMWICFGNYDRGVADIEIAIRMNPADPAATFEVASKTPIAEADLQHGQRQVRQMLRDRPFMEQYGEKAELLYKWAARKFASEDLNQKIFWDPAEPLFSTADNVPSPDGSGFIRVSGKHIQGPKKGKERSFEEMWRDAIFELYNINNGKKFWKLRDEAAEGKLSKEEFVGKTIEYESQAAEKIRAFYIRVFMPWANEHHVPTHPPLWYLAQRSDPSENILLQFATAKGPYWNFYERQHDWIILDSLVRKGENEKAIELADQMQKQAETEKEQAAICLSRGYCLLRLNRSHIRYHGL